MRPKMAVIGGGPAGLFAAIEGAERQLEVTLFEKGIIGDKVKCGEGLFDTLGMLGRPEAGVLFQVQHLTMRVKKRHRINNLPLDIWVIDRSRWQKSLKEKAAAMGVIIREKTPVSRPEIKKLAASFHWVVDASGPAAVTLPSQRQKCAVTYQYEMEGDFRFVGRGLYIGLEPNYPGYYWIFPRGDYQAKVGVGWLDPVLCRKQSLPIRSDLDRIMEKEQLNRYRILKKEGGLIPLGPRKVILQDNMFLTGDAAGLASSLHGGGIDMACLSGAAAAKAAARGRPREYPRVIEELIRRRHRRESKILKLWRDLSWEELDAVVALTAREENHQQLAFRCSHLAAGLTVVKAFLRK